LWNWGLSVDKETRHRILKLLDQVVLPQHAEDTLAQGSRVQAVALKLEFSLDREWEGRRKGGEISSKWQAGIWETALRLVTGNPRISNREAWKAVPEPPEEPTKVETPEADYEIYRDGKRLVQVDPFGRDTSIGQRTFVDIYLPKARRTMR
jgi:hypothetical protein